MRHRKRTFKIGRTTGHRRAMLANMVCSLFDEGQIRTTVVRAKEVRRLAERMITLGKRGTLHARRQAIAKLQQPSVVRTLFSDIAPTYAERNGGYTRILRLGQRSGDAADMCLLQLVTEPVPSAGAQEQPEAGTAADAVQSAAATAPDADDVNAEQPVADDSETDKTNAAGEAADTAPEGDDDREQKANQD